MTLTDEDKAFLIKIGQVVPDEVKDTKPIKPIKTDIEKDEV